MASTISVASLASSRTPLDSLRSPGPTSVLFLSATKSSQAISQSSSLISTKSQDDVADIDPDELFARYTIAEVKTRQAQLRADAEAKEEDLRIMVGERYRDLLQASSSIMSIATSAKRVHEALEETTTAIRSQKVPSAQNHVSKSGKDDSHLQTLQVLSAHIRLLLDAPEHLWRLIEREKYFQAAWLFLLARVVHRALVRDDAQDDESWTQHGIDILEQFPLIQRQWETVSHFRNQIIHRATLSLRSYDKSYDDTCATLLTLHILDSRPLMDTLMICLSQRSRTLNGRLAKGPDVPELPSNGMAVIGGPPETHKAIRLPAKTTALAVRSATRMTLEAISRTLYTARAVFGTSGPARSLAANVLNNIQSESSSAPSANLPAELLLTTQVVLNSLPSSTYVSLLPANIRAYRPFVDLSSVSSSLPQDVLRDTLSNWFDQSIANFRSAFDKWLGSLDAVSTVWKTRLSLRKWVTRSALLAHEKVNLNELLDEVFRLRIAEIWRAVLSRSEREFLELLPSLGSDTEEDMFSPLCSLYSTPPALQPPPGTGLLAFDANYDTYKATLAQRLHGRAPRLHEILQTLENAAASLQEDLARMFADGENSEKLVTDLTAACLPEAQALCVRVTSALKTSSEELISGPDINLVMSKLVFYAHIAKELSTSPFVCNIGCEKTAAIGFQGEMIALFQRIMLCWEEHVILKFVSRYTKSATTWKTYTRSTCIQPSPPMMECLYLLSSSIHNLGMSHHQPYQMTTPRKIFANFSAALAQSIDGNDSLETLQVLHDLSFLRHLASKWKIVETASLEHAIGRLQSHLGNSSKYDPECNASECLLRIQTLISAFLPPVPVAHEVASRENGDKMGAVLSCGVPAVDSRFVPVVELAPPSSRFPLLLVDTR